MSFNKYRTKGAYHYDWYETEDWYKWLVDRCVKFCKGSTLEVGCGDGVLANKIAENGYKVLGVDLDRDAINLAEEKKQSPNVKFWWLDVLARPTGRWDYMSCLNVIEHLDKPDVLKKIISKQIDKGAIITTIDWQGGKLGYDHKFEWTMDQLVDFFKEFNPKPFRYKDTEWIGVEIQK